MTAEPEKLTRVQLKQRLLPLIPQGADPDDVTTAVTLALTSESERIRPLARALGEDDVVYAWREADASLVTAALGTLCHLGMAFWTGPMGFGFALRELLLFLIQLQKHRVRVEEPLEVSILLLLHEVKQGLSAVAIRKRFIQAKGADTAPSLAEINQALDQLARATSPAGPKAVVLHDGHRWKSLV